MQPSKKYPENFPKTFRTKTISAKQYHTIKKKVESIAADIKGTGKERTWKDCAIDGGYNPRSASKGIHQDLSKNETCNEFLQKKLEDCGVTFDKLARKTKALMECKKGRGDKKEPDNYIQFHATRMATEMRNAFPSKRIDIHKEEYKMEFTPEMLRRLEKLEKMNKFKEVKVLKEVEVVEID